MSGSKHAARSARSRGGVLAAILAAAVLVLGGVSYAVVSFGGEGDDPQAGTDPTRSSAAKDKSSDPADGEAGEDASDESTQTASDKASAKAALAEADEELMAECQTGIEAAETAVDAAATGIGNLQGHVAAYEDWVAGKISEDTKSKRYAATRKRGPADIKRMEEASAGLAEAVDAADTACAEVLDECATRLDALENNVDTGKVGVAHWEEHLTNMEIFGGGKMSETRAQDLWDQTRAEMPEKIGPWKKAKKAVKSAPECAI